MPLPQNSYALPLALRLAVPGDWRELQVYVRQYAGELCNSLGLPAAVSFSFDSSKSDSDLFQLTVSGNAIRSRLWPQNALPVFPSSQDLSELICLALYDAREFLLTQDFASWLASDWGVKTKTGYDNGWSQAGFIHFLRAFLKFNFSLRHAKSFIETCSGGANSPSSAHYLFEQAVEEAADIEFGLAVFISSEECEEGKKLQYATAFKAVAINVAADLGLICPDIRVEAGVLRPGEFQIQLNAIRLPVIRGLARGEVALIANQEGLSKLGPRLMRLFDPRAGLWLACLEDSQETRQKATQLGIKPWEVSTAGYLGYFLKLIIMGNASSLLLPSVTYLLLENLKTTGNLTQSVDARFGQNPPFYRRLTTILRLLLLEQVSIGDLASILESLLSLREVKKENGSSLIYHFSEIDDSPVPVEDARSLAELQIDDLVFAARLGVRSLNVRTQQSGRQILPVLALPPQLQASLTSACGDHILLPHQKRQLVDLLNTRPMEDLAIVVRQNQRADIYHRLCHEAPTVPVLGSNEVSRTVFANAYYALGNSLRIRKSFFRAIQAFSEASSLAPENPHFYANLAYAVLLQADYLTVASLKSRLYNEAKMLYEQAIDINPKIAWYHLYLGSALGRLRRWDDATKELAETIRLDDKNYEARVALAYCLIRLGKFDDAMGELDQLNVPGLPPQLRNDLANNYAQAGDYAKAVAASEPASEDLQDAGKIAEKLQIEPQNAELHIELGKLHWKWKNFQTAAACYRNAISADPAKPDYQKLLGESLFEDGDWQGAASAWEEFLRSNPDDAITIYRTGLAYDALEQSQRALTFYRRAISLPSDQVAPLYVLANSHYRLAEIEEAKQAYKKALELKIDSPAVHFSLGNCYFKLGQLNDAISEWEAAIIASDSRYVEAYYNLGVAFWLTPQAPLENRTKAKLCWARALFLDPNLTIAEENIAAIETLDEHHQPRPPEGLEIFDLLHSRGV